MSTWVDVALGDCVRTTLDTTGASAKAEEHANNRAKNGTATGARKRFNHCTRD
ncbi:MAG: hypothetical protein BWX80_03002 [Candidatus Hydrogenedentes bacterium ADurb.Bin101]|nr:MAG: hypothetical protein BWX80_03002 [Candidatus Hydrogenedentes bacterium ADurb.Bin101]